MSAYAATTTKLRDAACLVTALNMMGFLAEVNDIPKPLVGYHGDVRQQKAEIIIRRQQIGSASNDVGFALQPDGTYAAIISQYDRMRFNAGWLNTLNQCYAEQAQVTEAERLGLVLQDREVIDGEVTLTFGLRE
jgi:hypothetical protein